MLSVLGTPARGRQVVDQATYWWRGHQRVSELTVVWPRDYLAWPREILWEPLFCSILKKYEGRKLNQSCMRVLRWLFHNSLGLQIKLRQIRRCCRTVYQVLAFVFLKAEVVHQINRNSEYSWLRIGSSVWIFQMYLFYLYIKIVFLVYST